MSSIFLHTRVFHNPPQFIPSLSTHVSTSYSISSSNSIMGRGASCASKASVASSTRSCWARSAGRPRVEPRLSLVSVTRGGLTARARPLCQLDCVVAMPLCSKARAISPTDWQHSGQLGTSSAASARCSLAMRNTSGINSSSTRAAFG